MNREEGPRDNNIGASYEIEVYNELPLKLYGIEKNTFGDIPHSVNDTQPGSRSSPVLAPVGLPPDPNFHWELLRQPAGTEFPPAMVGQVQRLALAVLAKLPSLTGRDHEVSFLLNILSDYPEMVDVLQNLVY